jgi:hypothetical protein
VTSDLLEQRLADLTIAAPDAGRITARVLSLAAKRQRRHFGRVAALAVATLGLMLGVLYFVPRTDAVLADTPIAGDLLRDAGLVGVGNRVTAVGAVSTSSGYRLELIAAYADSTRTVLLVHAQPGIEFVGAGPELKDQFGRTYHFSSGSANGLTGNLVLTFEALAWPDAITGARITLVWTAVEPWSCVIPAGGTSVDAVCTKGQLVTGSWTLPATVGIDEGTVVALPAPARLGAATFRFTSVVSTPATIEVEMEVTGMSFEQLNKTIPDGFKGMPAFSTDLIGPDGVNHMEGGGGTWSDDLLGTHIQIHLTWPRDASAAGDYRLRVTYVGLGEFERVLHIP